MENTTTRNQSVAATSDVEIDLPQWTRYLFIAFMVTIATVGIPANAFNVFSLSTFRGKKSTDVYVIAISVTDLISSSVCTIPYILLYEQTAWNVIASGVFCRLHTFLIHATSVCSTLIFAAIALDRYKVIFSGNNSWILREHAIKVAKRNCTIIAVVSCIFSTFHLLTTTLDEYTRLCSRTQNYKTLGYILNSVLALIFLFLSVATAFCYTRISILLKKNHTKMKNHKMDSIARTAVRKISVLFRQTTVYPIRETSLTFESISKESNPVRIKEKAGEEKSRASELGSSGNVSLKKNKMNKWTENAKKSASRVSTISIQSVNRQQQNNTESCLTTIEEFSSGNPHSSSRSEQVQSTIARDRKQMNRTTLVMFLLTLIYVTTWIISWLASIYDVSTGTKSPEVVFLLKRLFMLNSMTNPVLFILTSSNVRQYARNMLRM